MQRRKMKNILSIMLSTSILFNMVGCSLIKKNQNSNARNPLETSAEIQTEFFTNAAIVETYSSLLDKIDIEYENEQYYPDSQELEAFAQNSMVLGECQYQMSDSIDTEIEKSVANIKANSQAFLEKNPDYYYDINQYQGSEEWLSYTTNTGTDELLKYSFQRIFKNATNDIKEDFCNLQGFKVVFSNETGGPLGVLMDEDKLIIIYYQETIDSFKEEIPSLESPDDLDTEFYNYLAIVIEHELNHARQQICNHKETLTGTKDVSYCSPFITTIIESSAESSLYNQNIDEQSNSKNKDSYAYNEFRQSEALLFLLALTNSNINDYYNAIYDTNTAKLYEFFNLRTQEDIKLFYKILYAIDSQDLRTDLMANIYPNKNEITLGELVEMVGYNYRVDLFKLVLKNLMQYTQSNWDFSLEENVNLFIIISNYIVDETGSFEIGSDGTYRYFYDEELVKGIRELEEIYIDFLCSHYQTNKETIEKISTENYVEDVAALLNDTPLVKRENLNSIQKFLNRFPILKNINFAKKIPIDSYSKFLRDTELSIYQDTAYKLTLEK